MMILNEEQKLIDDSVQRYLEDQHDFARRQMLTRGSFGFDRNEWQNWSDLGWLGLPIDEHKGGFGGGLLDAAIIIRQLGHFLVRSPFLNTVVVAAQAIEQSASEQVQQDMLSDIASGSLTLTAAWYENDDPGHIDTVLQTDGDAYRLKGCKRLVPWGSQVDRVILSARKDEEIVLICVPLNEAGVDKLGYRMYDASRTSDISFNNVQIRPEWILGTVTIEQIQRIIDIETAMLCIEGSALMWRVFSDTLEYMKIREQFGQTLSSMQALQHQIVDIYVDCQLAQSMAEDAIVAACEAVDDQTENIDLERRVSMAKVAIADAGRRVAKRGIQLHGGIGMTDDIAVGHCYKRLSAIATLNGSIDWHRTRVSQN